LERPRTKTGRWVLPAFVSAVLLVACTQPVVSPVPPSATAGPTATAGTTTAPASAPPLATPTSSPAPSPVARTGWSRVPDVAAFAGQRVLAVARGPVGLVAVGRPLDANGDGGGGTIWTSSDGVAWSPVAGVPPNPTSNAGPLTAVTFWNGEFVTTAWGADFGPTKSTQEAFLWTSPDGATWRLNSRIDGSSGVDAFAAIGSRLVAGGSVCSGVSGPCATALWSTADGTTWRRSRLTGAGDMALAALVATPSGLVAIANVRGGARASGPSPVLRFAVWTSADGLSWSRPTIIPAGAATVTGATVLSSRLVIVGWVHAPGSSDSMGSAVWIADAGGTNWTRIPDQPSLRAGWMGHVMTTSGGLVAVGQDCNTSDACVPVVWRSPDGRTWAASQPAAMDSPGTSFDALAVIGDELVAFGYGLEGVGLWLGPSAP
jgi:hypothetical protein